MADDFEVLFKNYSPMVFRRCREILRKEEEAEDAFQDVFLRLAELMQEGYPISSYPCLLYTIATRKCFNRLRDSRVPRKKKEQGEYTKLDGNLSREVSFSPFNEEEKRIDANELVNNKLFAETFLLSLLEDEEDNSGESQVLEICYSYYFDEMGSKEIAETRGMPVSEVEKLFEARHIYFMYYFDDMTLEEISEIKGMSRSGIHKRLEKIKKRIDRLRKEEGNKTE